MEHENFYANYHAILGLQSVRSLPFAILHAKKCKAQSIFRYGLSSLRIRTRSLFIISSMGLFCFGLWGHLQPFEGILTIPSTTESISNKIWLGDPIPDDDHVRQAAGQPPHRVIGSLRLTSALLPPAVTMDNGHNGQWAMLSTTVW